MTKEEAIKYLQQLYPNGGHCWLDEQRIEAIGMAVNALQEEPVSEELEAELDKYIKDNFTIDKEQLDRFGIEEKDYMYSMDKSDMEKMVRYFTGNYKIPVSDDLEEAAKLCVSDSLCITNEEDWDDAAVDALNIFKAGAKWQFNQLEKNRLAACDRATKEEIEREQDFCDKIIIGEHRQPTYSDAIEYGIDWQKKQIMKGAIEREVKEDAGGYPYIQQMELYDYDKDVPLAKEGDKYKVVLIKED